MSIGAKAMTGLTWMVGSTVLSRAATLLGQVILGWLLLPDDFGAYAFALSVSTVVAAIRNGGISQVVIQRRDEYPQRAGLFLKYSLAFNVLAMLVLLAIGIPLWIDGSPVGLILSAIAVSIPLGTPAVLLKAKLTIDGRFREVAAVTLWSAIVWQASAVCFALLGWGALSFAVAPLLQAAYENAAGWWLVRALPSLRQKEGLQQHLRLLRDTRWLMLSAALLALSTTGVYFVVGLVHDAATLGTYFFAFQLVVAFSMPLYGAIESVLPSLFVQLEPDRTRQTATYVRTLKTALVVGLPLCGIFSLAIPAIMHLTWQGKWDAAAPLAQTLSACMPAWIVVAIGRSLIEARGLWRLRFVVVGSYGGGGMTAAAIGAFAGDAATVSQFVTVYYVCFAAIFLVFMAKWLAIPFESTISSVAVPVVLNCTAFICGITLSRLMYGIESPLRDVIGLASFLLLAGLGNYWLLRDVWSQLLDGVKQRIQRLQAA